LSKNIFFELHHNLPREGPGNNESTRKAFEMLAELPSDACILDIGCGPGMQTIQLAKLTNGTITAVDTHEPFLTEVKQRAVADGLGERILPRKASMFTLPFDNHSFDVIWSEGSIYIMGFEQGLKAWRPFLKPGGYLAVSELAWLDNHPPTEAAEFWEKNYPGMKTVEDHLRAVEQSGYTLIGHFVLPESGWWDDYYLPMEQRILALRETYRNDTACLGQLDEAQQEIDLFRKYSNYYGYVFYVMQAD
jgi:SAM-dependent methyltransferase